ncbi:putative Exonuclease 1 [Paratrimastix pyriformis]|uniref:Exonuclease 1 n=1 Tax=Paratrimastix pyriformis TaxID=342808 RepID=A0ABQ8UWA4_9EUKA|nr:putative Exonuclease 1 [Paratrimastix pyriformis]
MVIVGCIVGVIHVHSSSAKRSKPTIIVFDGRHLPMKMRKEEERGLARDQSRLKGLQHLRSGNRAAALEAFQKSVDVTPRMAWQVIQALKKEDIEFMVAPYEADAQLAYLYLNRLVSAVITEDSDLLAFGCETVLFKMDKTGSGKLLELSRLNTVTEVSFSHFTMAMFTQMCILSGCDYTPSIKGMGLKKAHRLLCQYKTIDQVLRMIHYDLTLQVPTDYEQAFRQAELTFAHQSVFGPTEQRIVPVRPYPPGKTSGDFEFAGPYLEPEIAQKISRGEIDPFTLEPFSESPPETMSQSTPNSPPSRTQPPPRQTTLTSFFPPPLRNQKSRTASPKRAQDSAVTTISRYFSVGSPAKNPPNNARKKPVIPVAPLPKHPFESPFVQQGRIGLPVPPPAVPSGDNLLSLDDFRAERRQHSFAPSTDHPCEPLLRSTNHERSLPPQAEISQFRTDSPLSPSPSPPHVLDDDTEERTSNPLAPCLFPGTPPRGPPAEVLASPASPVPPHGSVGGGALTLDFFNQFRSERQVPFREVSSPGSPPIRLLPTEPKPNRYRSKSSQFPNHHRTKVIQVGLELLSWLPAAFSRSAQSPTAVSVSVPQQQAQIFIPAVPPPAGLAQLPNTNQWTLQMAQRSSPQYSVGLVAPTIQRSYSTGSGRGRSRSVANAAAFFSPFYTTAGYFPYPGPTPYRTHSVGPDGMTQQIAGVALPAAGSPAPAPQSPTPTSPVTPAAVRTTSAGYTLGAHLAGPRQPVPATLGMPATAATAAAAAAAAAGFATVGLGAGSATSAANGGSAPVSSTPATATPVQAPAQAAAAPPSSLLGTTSLARPMSDAQQVGLDSSQPGVLPGSPIPGGAALAVAGVGSQQIPPPSAGPGNRAKRDSFSPLQRLSTVEMDELIGTGLTREQIANWRGLYRSRMKLKSIKPHYVTERHSYLAQQEAQLRAQIQKAHAQGVQLQMPFAGDTLAQLLLPAAPDGQPGFLQPHQLHQLIQEYDRVFHGGPGPAPESTASPSGAGATATATATATVAGASSTSAEGESPSSVAEKEPAELPQTPTAQAEEKPSKQPPKKRPQRRATVSTTTRTRRRVERSPSLSSGGSRSPSPAPTARSTRATRATRRRGRAASAEPSDTPALSPAPPQGLPTTAEAPPEAACLPEGYHRCMRIHRCRCRHAHSHFPQPAPHPAGTPDAATNAPKPDAGAPPEEPVPLPLVPAISTEAIGLPPAVIVPPQVVTAAAAAAPAAPAAGGASIEAFPFSLFPPLPGAAPAAAAPPTPGTPGVSPVAVNTPALGDSSAPGSSSELGGSPSTGAPSSSPGQAGPLGTPAAPAPAASTTLEGSGALVTPSVISPHLALPPNPAPILGDAATPAPIPAPAPASGSILAGPSPSVAAVAAAGPRPVVRRHHRHSGPSGCPLCGAPGPVGLCGACGERFRDLSHEGRLQQLADILRRSSGYRPAAPQTQTPAPAGPAPAGAPAAHRRVFRHYHRKPARPVVAPTASPVAGPPPAVEAESAAVLASFAQPPPLPPPAHQPQEAAVVSMALEGPQSQSQSQPQFQFQFQPPSQSQSQSQSQESVAPDEGLVLSQAELVRQPSASAVGQVASAASAASTVRMAGEEEPQSFSEWSQSEGAPMPDEWTSCTEAEPSDAEALCCCCCCCHPGSAPTADETGLLFAGMTRKRPAAPSDDEQPEPATGRAKGRPRRAATRGGRGGRGAAASGRRAPRGGRRGAEGEPDARPASPSAGPEAAKPAEGAASEARKEKDLLSSSESDGALEAAAPGAEETDPDQDELDDQDEDTSLEPSRSRHRAAGSRGARRSRSATFRLFQPACPREDAAYHPAKSRSLRKPRKRPQPAAGEAAMSPARDRSPSPLPENPTGRVLRHAPAATRRYTAPAAAASPHKRQPTPRSSKAQPGTTEASRELDALVRAALASVPGPAEAVGDGLEDLEGPILPPPSAGAAPKDKDEAPVLEEPRDDLDRELADDAQLLASLSPDRHSPTSSTIKSPAQAPPALTALPPALSRSLSAPETPQARAARLAAIRSTPQVLPPVLPPVPVSPVPSHEPGMMAIEEQPQPPQPCGDNGAAGVGDVAAVLSAVPPPAVAPSNAVVITTDQ